MPFDNCWRKLKGPYHPPSTPRTQGARAQERLAWPGGLRGAQAWLHSSPRGACAGASEWEAFSVVSSQTTSRFQAQTCLLADVETGFQSSQIKPSTTSTEFRVRRGNSQPRIIAPTGNIILHQNGTGLNENFLNTSTKPARGAKPNNGSYRIPH